MTQVIFKLLGLSFSLAIFHFKSLLYFDYPSVRAFFNKHYDGLEW
ncbi:MAG: hypothetical protein ACJAXS_003199 [Colwellia sp.]|jgi:hypothetical protein